MKIEQNNYDKNYPYTIKDSWGGAVCCDEKDLIELKEKIEKILDKQNNK